MAGTAIHSFLNNDTGRELHKPGYDFTTYADLLAETTMQRGDVAIVTMNGNSVYFFYDTSIGHWRLLGPYWSTTSAGIGSLAGMQEGDDAYMTDTHQKAYWNGTIWVNYP